MRATWYVLEDGSVVDPNEVSPDDDGVLRHKGGGAVAMRGNVPSTTGVDLENMPKEPAKRSGGHDSGKPHGKDMKADKSKPYKTRESKAD